LGQFPRCDTRSHHWASAPGRGSSGPRGSVCTGSRPQPRRAATYLTNLIHSLRRRSCSSGSRQSMRLVRSSSRRR
jgi:hypothetical protein